jgi:hypothetical protein
MNTFSIAENFNFQMAQLLILHAYLPSHVTNIKVFFILSILNFQNKKTKGIFKNKDMKKIYCERSLYQPKCLNHR